MLRPFVSCVSSRTQLDFENGFVLVVGWVVAFAVTWT
jgi:hypothetical protein